MGISENHLASIFEPFMQAHKTSSENSRGGIGLGLSIVKKHLEQIKGTISVDSELGKGSTFRVALPKNYNKSQSRAHRFFGFFKRQPAAQSTTTANIRGSAFGYRKAQSSKHQSRDNLIATDNPCESPVSTDNLLGTRYRKSGS